MLVLRLRGGRKIETTNKTTALTVELLDSKDNVKQMDSFLCEQSISSEEDLCCHDVPQTTWESYICEQSISTNV